MNSFIKIFVLGIILSSFVFSSCNTKHRIWIGKNRQQKIFNLEYGSHERHKMDIFLPAEYPQDTPIVVLIHGGFWKIGSKNANIHLQKYLLEKGIPSINLNYRLVNRRKKITYKDQLEDIRLALDKFNHLAMNAKLKPDNYILWGESSGGHLALLYGYRNPNSIRGIIAFSAPTDFYSSHYLNSFYSRLSSPLFEDVVGEKFDRKNVSEEFKKASPIANVANVPTLLLQGNSDLLIHKKQGILLDSALTKNKIEHQTLYMQKTGHRPHIFNKEKRDKIIYPAIIDFIQSIN